MPILLSHPHSSLTAHTSSPPPYPVLSFHATNSNRPAVQCAMTTSDLRIVKRTVLKSENDIHAPREWVLPATGIRMSCARDHALSAHDDAVCLYRLHDSGDVELLARVPTESNENALCVDEHTATIFFRNRVLVLATSNGAVIADIMLSQERTNIFDTTFGCISVVSEGLLLWVLMYPDEAGALALRCPYPTTASTAPSVDRICDSFAAQPSECVRVEIVTIRVARQDDAKLVNASILTFDGPANLARLVGKSVLINHGHDSIIEILPGGETIAGYIRDLPPQRHPRRPLCCRFSEDEDGEGRVAALTLTGHLITLRRIESGWRCECIRYLYSEHVDFSGLAKFFRDTIVVRCWVDGSVRLIDFERPYARIPHLEASVSWTTTSELIKYALCLPMRSAERIGDFVLALIRSHGYSYRTWPADLYNLAEALLRRFGALHGSGVLLDDIEQLGSPKLLPQGVVAPLPGSYLRQLMEEAEAKVSSELTL